MKYVIVITTVLYSNTVYSIPTPVTAPKTDSGMKAAHQLLIKVAHAPKASKPH